MIKQSIETMNDIRRRHKERHTSLGLAYVISDSIDFLNAEHWDSVARGKTLFLTRHYLRAIENCSPLNIQLRYVLIYSEKVPVAILACQIADISGEQFIEVSDTNKLPDMLSKIERRILVCGNLISSGLHGVAFADDFDVERGWRSVAEVLYRIRRGDKLNGNIDFAMIKDLKEDVYASSKVLSRYSYRPIKTDPDMVLSFPKDCSTYEDYLTLLTSKYRTRAKKIRQGICDAGFTIERLPCAEVIARDMELHSLYMEVEQRAPIRLATITPGYFSAMAESLGANFCCTVIKEASTIIGFIITLKDGDMGIAYYVGINYVVNENHPLYLCLLQLSVEDALTLGCQTLSMGRSALEPKANLGAKPVETQVWMRHRHPLVNFAIRKLFPIIPYGEAPERGALK